MLIELAGISIDILNEEEAVFLFFDKYKSDKTALFSVYVNEEEIENERKMAEHKNLKRINYLLSAIYRKICDKIIDYDIILFHSSTLIIDDLGIAFSGVSGAGKSTHASLYKKYFDATMINDDKPLIKLVDDEFIIYGTPFDGKHHLSNNINHKLNDICFINQAKTNKINKLDNKEALELLLNQTYRPKDQLSLLKVIKIVNKMANSIPVYKLDCDISKEAAELSYGTFKRNI